MTNNLIIIATLLGLLIGLAIGKAWERYKLQEGRWIDRRKARESPHYILGLNFLASNQLDLAIEELTKAAELHPDTLDIHLILGNLYREKGQVSKAIQVHQSLLQRPRLTRLQHAYVLFSLGLDFKRGGFVDRAFEAFSEVVKLDSGNRYALLNLEKLHEEQHQWREAQVLRRRMDEATSDPEGPEDQAIVAFLENELGLQAMRGDALEQATRHFETAIDLILAHMWTEIAQRIAGFHSQRVKAGGNHVSIAEILTPDQITEARPQEQIWIERHAWAD